LSGLSFLTSREKQVVELWLQLGQQRKVAKKLGVGDSVISLTLQNVKLKSLKAVNTVKECSKYGLLTEDQLIELVSKSKIIDSTKKLSESSQNSAGEAVHEQTIHPKQHRL
jgi:transposase